MFGVTVDPGNRGISDAAMEPISYLVDDPSDNQRRGGSIISLYSRAQHRGGGGEEFEFISSESPRLQPRTQRTVQIFSLRYSAWVSGDVGIRGSLRFTLDHVSCTFPRGMWGIRFSTTLT